VLRKKREPQAPVLPVGTLVLLPTLWHCYEETSDPKTGRTASYAMRVDFSDRKEPPLRYRLDYRRAKPNRFAEKMT
jgi:hypothetical protein